MRSRRGAVDGRLTGRIDGLRTRHQYSNDEEEGGEKEGTRKKKEGSTGMLVTRGHVMVLLVCSLYSDTAFLVNGNCYVQVYNTLLALIQTVRGNTDTYRIYFLEAPLGKRH